ncbi:MAG: TrmB family transcriptional regulator [Caldivirga sp.]|jgi:predicted transcriptional regulator of viral defense system|uniref:TrmB family transcriptional regulator n=1 Tax=Caldivirga sp. MU80 TaxID=1650354 RepID=UPI0007463E76|nr:TrmB family transcriptional regulator [Caldivirga sp. MU80]KUO85006.1 MAG: TrmB family transcriptional regulator [Caldivirga sp. MG_3]KUO90697.1 MAG: TrmB family transcriptional regulator [Caldivirga sp. JCHS_4]NAZ28462.1 TrmB family transcriptional regulator [Caldivirga sp.]
MSDGIKKKILDYLTQNRGKELAVEDIAKAVGEQRLNVVKAQLTRLAKEGRVQKVAEGKYKAV